MKISIQSQHLVHALLVAAWLISTAAATVATYEAARFPKYTITEVFFKIGQAVLGGIK
ncbi:MAG: hypothetical protein WCV99_06765 [Sterolibacterium sp.]